MRISRRGAAMLAVFTSACVLLVITSACQPREREQARPTYRAQPDPTRQRVVVAAPTPVRETTQPQAPQPRQLPAITSEPQVDVLVARGGMIELQLLTPGQSAVLGKVGRGRLTVQTQGANQIAVSRSGTIVTVDAPLTISLSNDGSESFYVIGDSVRDRRFSGDVKLVRQAEHIIVCESVPMERYLHGVIQREVEPDWPLEALKAQAVAARSYATARWLERHDRPWQLDASEQVDMAYAGVVTKPHIRLATAVNQTRGNVLWFADQPLPAYFHASSGGHSENIMVVWPNRTMPDGLTSPAGGLVYRRDTWDEPGRQVAPKRLGAWRVDLSLADVRNRLIAAGHKGVGVITELKITERDPVSARARKVRISWQGGHFDISAHGLRMAMGSTKVKSTLWRDFRHNATTLTIQGHGYGHGIGLPQASAWAMARAGHLAPVILKQYYPGTQLVRKW